MASKSLATAIHRWISPASVNKMNPSSRSIHRLRTFEKYSDMTLKCNQTVFKVHHAIVCTKSAVLAAAIDGNFKVWLTRGVKRTQLSLTPARKMPLKSIFLKTTFQL